MEVAEAVALAAGGVLGTGEAVAVTDADDVGVGGELVALQALITSDANVATVIVRYLISYTVARSSR